MMAAAGAGLAASVVFRGDPQVVLATLTVWLISAYHRGPTVISPARPQIRALASSAATALAAVALAVGLHVVQAAAVPAAVHAVGVATGVAVAVRLLRRRLHGSVRTFLVGDRVAVTDLSSRWLGAKRVGVVGVCVVEPDLADKDYPQEVLGAPVIRSMDDIAAAVESLRADSVIVCPGPGFTATDLRRLVWDLEPTETPSEWWASWTPSRPPRQRRPPGWQPGDGREPVAAVVFCAPLEELA